MQKTNNFCKVRTFNRQRPGAVIMLDAGLDRATSLAINLLVLTEWSPASKISMACISLPVERMNVVWHACVDGVDSVDIV